MVAKKISEIIDDAGEKNHYGIFIFMTSKKLGQQIRKPKNKIKWPYQCIFGSPLPVVEPTLRIGQGVSGAVHSTTNPTSPNRNSPPKQRR